MKLLNGLINLGSQDVKFQIQYKENEHKNLELIFENISKENLDKLHKLKHIDKLCGIDYSNFYFIFYECKIVLNTLNFARDPQNPTKDSSRSTAHVFVEYKEAIKMYIFTHPINNVESICNCDIFTQVYFTFSNIDKIFKKERFTIKNETQFDKMVIEKEKLEVRSVSINDFVLFIGTNVHNSARSFYDIEIHQEKTIEIRYKCGKSLNLIIDDILKIKHYFEFILQTEIELLKLRFDYIEKINATSHMLRSADLVKSKRFSNYTVITHNISPTLFDSKKINILEGLFNWFRLYHNLINSISIWQKTIYNANKDKIDEIIWYCQSLELLCSSFDDLIEKSKTFINPRQSYPNIGNYIIALQEKLSICEFQNFNKKNDIKIINKVRNKCIHNNPETVVTEEEINQTHRLLKYYYINSILKLLNINGIDIYGILDPKLDPYGNAL